MARDARNITLSILNRLDKGRETLDSVLEGVLDESDLLSQKDRALLNALVYGVLRWRGRLDWIIGHFSKTRLNKIDPKVLNLLRLGLFQIMFLDKIPVSAAVNTSVEMSKAFSAPWVAGFVNALLRNMAGRYPETVFPGSDTHPVAALAAEKSFPSWLIKRWQDRLGIKETVAICDALNCIPPITIRTNTLKTTREDLVKSLQDRVEGIRKTPYAPDGIFFFSPSAAISQMKSFQDGWFQVQDEAAQLITFMLDPQPGETVLDACAGLGGKTGHIAQVMKNRGKIVALDKDKTKLSKLEDEMARLGVSIVASCRHDLDAGGVKQLGMFDRVLLDAPCSGLGVVRRNPDIKWRVSEKSLSRYGLRQMNFLSALAAHVKPSGTLAYAVCSTEPEENEEVIKAFLNKHSEFVIENEPKGLPVTARSFVSPSGYFISLPHVHNTDGFFSVSLKRIK